MDWAVDFGIIAAIAASVAHWRSLVSSAAFMTTSQVTADILGTLGTHTVLGALLGVGLCMRLERARGQVSFSSMWPFLLGSAALWGMASLLISRTWFFSLSWDMGGAELQHLCALLLGGAAFGAVVYGPLCGLYTLLSVYRVRARWLLIALSTITSLLGTLLSQFLIQLVQG